MPKLAKVPADASPLWKWMERHKVTIAALAAALDVTPNYLGDVRRGLHRPSDDLKLAIEKTTAAMERKAGAKNPKGVRPADWFAAPAPKRSRAA